MISARSILREALQHGTPSRNASQSVPAPIGSVPNSRVVLREMVRADVDEMARWPRFVEPELQWANLELLSTRDRDLYYERGRSNSTRRRFVVLDQAGAVIGTLGIRNIDHFAEQGTLGIIIAADKVGKSYGRDAIRVVLAHAFGDLKMRRVILDVAENNPRADRCYLNLGFTETGRHIGPGALTYIDMVIYKQTYLMIEGSR